MFTFWVDGTKQATWTNIDNDIRRIDYAQLGPVANIDTGTRGTEYFDCFSSKRTTYIGPDGTALNPPPWPTTLRLLLESDSHDHFIDELPHPPQPCQKIHFSALPVAKPCCSCIPFHQTVAALHEPVPFSALQTNIRQQNYFRSPFSSPSSCLPFQPFETHPAFELSTQFCIFFLSYLPDASLHMYNLV